MKSRRPGIMLPGESNKKGRHLFPDTGPPKTTIARAFQPRVAAARSGPPYGLELEVELEPDLQHAWRDDLLRAAEVRRRFPCSVEGRLVDEALGEVADAVLHRVRVQH